MSNCTNHYVIVANHLNLLIIPSSLFLSLVIYPNLLDYIALNETHWCDIKQVQTDDGFVLALHRLSGMQGPPSTTGVDNDTRSNKNRDVTKKTNPHQIPDTDTSNATVAPSSQGNPTLDRNNSGLEFSELLAPPSDGPVVTPSRHRIDSGTRPPSSHLANGSDERATQPTHSRNNSAASSPLISSVGSINSTSENEFPAPPPLSNSIQNATTYSSPSGTITPGSGSNHTANPEVTIK